MLTVYKMHHPKADKGRLYVKTNEGGRGLVQIVGACKAKIINIAEYLCLYNQLFALFHHVFKFLTL